MGWDPRSRIQDQEKKPIPGPGSRGQKGTGSWIRICNTARSLSVECQLVNLLPCIVLYIQGARYKSGMTQF
jgi:hypothetical protein